jgi:protein O-GlcNAc transferase
MTGSTEGDLQGAIARAIRDKRFQRADLAIRALLDREPDNPAPHLLLADLAAELGRWQIHASAQDRAAGRGAEFPPSAPQTERSSGAPSGHLVATEWGHGFWSDVAHVLGSVLLAEMTGRTPTVHWSSASLFSPGDGKNAWDRYFEPIGPELPLVPRAESYFPEPWDHDALQSDALCQVRVQRPVGSHGLALLPRAEQVVVSDTFVGVNDLWPWLEPGNVDFGTSLIATKRRLATRYLRVRPHLTATVDNIWSRYMAGRRWLAVHIRGSDKVDELDTLADVNSLYPARIDQWLAQDEDRAVFLMTDSIPHFFAMRERYGPRLLTLKAIRTQSKVGVHRGGHDPVQVAEQVLVDTLLATRCDAFLGNGTSNVSLAVEYLKDWPAGTYQFVGPDWREVRYTL